MEADQGGGGGGIITAPPTTSSSPPSSSPFPIATTTITTSSAAKKKKKKDTDIKTSMASPSTADNDGNGNANDALGTAGGAAGGSSTTTTGGSSSLWGNLGDMLERSATAPPTPRRYDEAIAASGAPLAAVVSSAAAAPWVPGAGGADTLRQQHHKGGVGGSRYEYGAGPGPSPGPGADHAGGGGGGGSGGGHGHPAASDRRRRASAAVVGDDDNSGNRIMMSGGAGLSASISYGLSLPVRPKTTEPDYGNYGGYSDYGGEYGVGGAATGTGTGIYNHQHGTGIGPAGGSRGGRRGPGPGPGLPPGLGGAVSTPSLTNIRGSTTNVHPDIDIGSAAPTGTSADRDSDRERGLLFETGLGIRRPASTGLINIGDSNVAIGSHEAAQVASTEVLKSLGLVLPTTIATTASATATSRTAAADGTGTGSATNNMVETTATSKSTSGSGSALMELIQQDIRKSKSVSTTPPQPEYATTSNNNDYDNDYDNNYDIASGLSAGVKAMSVADTTMTTAAAGIGATAVPLSSANISHGQTKNQVRYDTAAAPSRHSHSQYEYEYSSSSPYSNRQRYAGHQERSYDPAGRGGGYGRYDNSNQNQGHPQYHGYQYADPHYQQQQQPPSPLFVPGMGMAHGSSPPEYMLHGMPAGLGLGGGSPPEYMLHGGRSGVPPPPPPPPQAAVPSAAAAQTVYYTQGPNGQTQAIYVNAGPPPSPHHHPHHSPHSGHSPYNPPHPPPPPHGYGYATIQYHTGRPPDQQAGGAAQHQHQQVIHLNAGGAGYSYYPAGGGDASPYGHGHAGDESLMPQQTVTVMNAHGQPTTIAVAPAFVQPTPTRAGGGRNRGGGGGGGGGGGMSPPSRSGGGRSGSRPGVNNGRNGGVRNANTNANANANGRIAGATGPLNPLLEEFRSSKSTTWTIFNIKGSVVDFCQDQNGSRFIQQRLEVAGSAEKEAIMEEVRPGLTDLCADVFGNYVVQKLLELGDDEMREDIMKNALKGEMLSLSKQMYGCRVVQKSFETLDIKHFPVLLEEFKDDVVNCIHDANGNHVCQKIIECLSSKAKAAKAAGDAATANFLRDQIQFVIDDILANIAPLSCHPFGCRVLQRILEHCVEPQKTDVLDALQLCHKTLLDDQYGNYVIQHVLQHGRVSDRQSLLQIIVASGILTLSRQKFASNVVEKLLKYGTPGQRNRVVAAMLKKVAHDDSIPSLSPGGTPIVILMVRDAFANYVVQTALDVTPEGEERRQLINVLNSNVNLLRQYTYAKHILQKLGQA